MCCGNVSNTGEQLSSRSKADVITSVDVSSSDRLQGDSAALHLFSGHQLLLDPG